MDFIHNTAFLLPLSTLIGVAVGYYLHRKFTEHHRQNIEEQGKKLIEHAILEAEQTKKEALLQCKNEIYQLKNQAEKENRKRENNILAEERRLAGKLDHLEAKIDILDQKETRLHSRENQLEQFKAGLQKKEEQYNRLIDESRRELERVSCMSAEDAKNALMSSMESEARMEAAKRLLQLEQETKAVADQKARKILALAVSRYAAEFVMEKTVSIVPLPNDEMKGRIIGREGRNIRAIEAATGIDIIIDDTPEAVVLSGFDPVRRETARLALEQLIVDGRIHPARIEEVVEKARKEIARLIKETGEQATFDVGVHGVHEDIVKLLGRLKYRTSYTQNVLQHSLEVAFLCGIMASELGLDVKEARRAGLLHDIGKAVDHEVEGSHAVIGRDIARKYGESAEIVYAIGAHHEDEPPTSVLDILVQAADALSGARPGARKEMLQTYVKRLEGLEKIANSFAGVEKSYAIQAGRDLRIIVNSEIIDDSKALLLSKDIAKQVEQELTYPGQIKVTVIRETRAVEYAQ